MLSQVKRVIAWLAYHVRLWQGVAWLCGRVNGRPLLAAFTFHRVVVDPPPDTHLQGYERGQSLSSFVAQLEAVGRIFEICDLSEFSDLAAGSEPAGRRPHALLTFDDADSLHGHIVFPVLVERGWPGVSFVPTGFIETDRRFYHLRLTNICNHLSESDWRQVLKEPLPAGLETSIRAFVDSKMADRRAFRRDLIPAFHTMDIQTRDHLLDAWERLVPGYTLGIECANWAAISSWEANRIQIGSHSVNHNRFALLDRDAVRFELVASRQALCQRLRGAVGSVSYPEGSYTEAVPALAEEAGYHLGFTTATGFVPVPIQNTRKYLIPRITLAGDTPSLAACSMGRLMLKHLVGSLRRVHKSGPAD